MSRLNKILLERIIHSLSRIFFWLARRVLVLYLITGLLFAGLVSRTRVVNKAKTGALNRLMPTFEYLADFNKRHGMIDNKKMREYAHYYEVLARYAPSLSEVHAMLGYCHYYLGKYDRSIASYRKAVGLNPRYFWFHHNLGVVYFQEKHYREAAAALEAALATELNIALPITYSFQAIRPILALEPEQELPLRMKANVRKGYVNCLLLLVMSHYHLNNFSQVILYATEAAVANLGEQEFFYYYAGISAYKMGQFETAASFFQKCINNNPKNADAFHYGGMALKMLKNEQAADKFLRQAELLGYRDGHETMAFDKRIELEIY